MVLEGYSAVHALAPELHLSIDILELKKLVALDDDFTGVELSLESGFGFDFTESFVDSAGLISVWQVLGELSSCVA